VRSSLILLCAVLLGSQALASEQLLRDCAARLNNDSVGLEALDTDCPGLAKAVQASEYSAFISDTQAEQLTRESLLDLLSLQARYQERGTASPSLDPAAVAAALQGLQRAPPPRIQPKSWWDVFKEWLTNQWSGVYDKNNWLSRWLQRANVPAKLALGLLVAVSLIIVAAAVVILVVELRAAGVFARGRARFAPTTPAPKPAGDLTLADLDATAVGERLPLLFRLLIAALSQSGRLQADRAMTHRELTRRASFDADGQQQQFGEIAVLAERTLYGGRSASGAELERALQSGRTLYAQLLPPTGPQPAESHT
jgi:hypothetical protein